MVIILALTECLLAMPPLLLGYLFGAHRCPGLPLPAVAAALQAGGCRTALVKPKPEILPWIKHL